VAYRERRREGKFETDVVFLGGSFSQLIRNDKNAI
jgi:hypothetical protein